MKKTYIDPKMVIVEIHTHSLLAGSLGYNSTAVDAANADSRSLRQIFDDEEDD